ncbi:MAG: Smr/MutS family protein [Bacteroidota bacterium]|jgi:hypothetical protein
MSTHFYIGERVRFLESKGEGIIKSFRGNEAIVEDESGFDWPTPLNKIVKIFSEKEPQKEFAPEKDYTQINLENALYLFIPEKEENNRTKKIKLINNCGYDFLVALFFSEKNHHKRLFYNCIKAKSNSDFFEIDDLNDLKSIKIQLLPVPEKSSEVFGLIEDTVKIGNSILLGDEEPTYHNSIAIAGFFRMLLSEKIINDSLLQKNLLNINQESQSKNFAAKPPITNYKEELIVDLHIEALTENSGRMTAGEKLNFQLIAFEKHVSTAFSQGYKKLIIIHGVGKGVLKDNILEKLKDYSFAKHKDADYNKFGYGATEISFK